MKRIPVLIPCLLIGAAAAQGPPFRSEMDSIERLRRIERLIDEWQGENENPELRQRLMEMQEAEHRRMEFAKRSSRFVAAWNRVMQPERHLQRAGRARTVQGISRAGSHRLAKTVT
jgi:hypothetical protein